MSKEDGNLTIYEALSGLDIPVQHPPYRGDAQTYVTYSLLGQDGTVYADGSEKETSVSYAVNVYAPGNYISIMLAVKSALETAGYIVVVDTEYYEYDVELQHVVLTASIEGALYG